MSPGVPPAKRMEVEVEGKRLSLSNLDKVFYPATGFTKGQVIGTVGGEGTPEGAHVEFQIREPGGGAVDPVTWLRRRG